MLAPPEEPNLERAQQRYLTVQEVADILAVGNHAVYNLIHSEALPHVRLKRRIRIDPDALDEWLSERSRRVGAA